MEANQKHPDFNRGRLPRLIIQPLRGLFYERVNMNYYKPHIQQDYIDACLLRSLLDEPWGEHLAKDDEAKFTHLRHLKTLCLYEFSDEAIEEYQATLNPDERFREISEFRRYLAKEILKRLSWIAGQRL